MKISTLSFPVISLSLVLAVASAPGAVRDQLVLDTSGNLVRHCTRKGWKVVLSRQLRESVISTGGPAESIYIGFGIAKEGDAYKIRHCVQTSCNDVGVVTGDLGVRRMVLGGEPFTVKFQKAYEANDGFDKTMLRMLPFYK